MSCPTYCPGCQQCSPAPPIAKAGEPLWMEAALLHAEARVERLLAALRDVQAECESTEGKPLTVVGIVALTNIERILRAALAESAERGEEA